MIHETLRTTPGHGPRSGPKRDPLKERQDRKRRGSRAEFDPRSGGEGFTARTERAVAEIGMYRTVAYKDLSEAHFDGHPYATRRAVDRMIQQGDVRGAYRQGVRRAAPTRC